MKSKFRRIACLSLTAIMATSFTASNVLAALTNNNSSDTSVSDRYTSVSYENVTGKVDLSAVAISNFSSAVIKDTTTGTTSTVSGTQKLIVTLQGDSILSLKDENQTASEYLATAQGAKALRNINKEQEQFYTALAKAGVGYSVVDSYSTITNSVVIEADTADITTIKNLDVVKSVVFSSSYAYPETTTESADNATTNASNVYATGIYDSSDYTSQGIDGSGITVAILDTGLDYTHSAFTTYMPETVAFTKGDIEEVLASKELNAEKLSGATADDVYINSKVPFAYDYADKDADVYPSYSQHGTHVAGIVAGHDDSYTDKNGNTVNSEFLGVAPNAQLVICKVFTDDFDSKDLGGATTEDILAALEDCVLLNVDIINMSLGTSAGFSTTSIDGDTEGNWMNEVYTSIQSAGINLICAASNDFSSGYGSAYGTNLATNPDSGTVGSPSTFVGAMSVASINGQLSRYMTVDVANNDGGTDRKAIYYLDSSDANSVQYDFNEQMLGTSQSQTFKYVVVPGVGQPSDYTSTIKSLLNDKADGEKVIAVVKRGTTTFQDKVDTAARMGADAIIVYNNVAGTVRMSLGDLDDPIPSVSVNMDAGTILTSVGRTGYITLNQDYQAGPFMNDYSSWGSTPDLKLKPDVTAHGGEITSTVSGGYDEMSGTSMASPNLAGFAALLRSYLKNSDDFGDLSAVELTRLSNQIIMSTATTVYDQEGNPYSPRKQGSGLATLDNVFSTKAYLFTDGANAADDNRPKVELGADKDKTGVYTISFKVKNFGTDTLTFSPQAIFITETLSSDGLAVAEKAYALEGNPVWNIDGYDKTTGKFTVAAGATKTISVTLSLTDAEKKYLDESFENGMFVEGFIKLNSTTDGQCDLTLPFMGFYGDWENSPLLDYDCYQITEFKQDASYTDDTRPQAQVWATQPYASYYNSTYTVPMGSFLYVQDESAEQIYTMAEHTSISRYNDFISDESYSNYMTTTSIKALYAGLLRNCELVTYKLYNTTTGELVKEDSIYRVNKAYAGGGSAVPAQVLLELDPEELGLVANGQYTMDFNFYFKEADKDDPDKQDNTFSMTFYLDYEAPILVDSRLRYEDYKDGNQDKQRIYLDLDIYDNHYAQAVMLCYADKVVDGDTTVIKLATDYVTPVYNAVKNGTTTVSIEVTDIIEKYSNSLYVQIDDYALNYSVYSLSLSTLNGSVLPSTFSIAADSRITTDANGNKSITISKNEAYKLSLDISNNANISNFTWDSIPQRVVQVKNGEIFGASVGQATVTVTGLDGAKDTITVNVVDSNLTLATPTISFNTILNYNDAAQKATGTVGVNAGQTFSFEIVADPWYYPVENLKIKWSSSDTRYATVESNGGYTATVKTLDEKGTSIIKAVILDENNRETLYSAVVTLNVQEPFTVSGSTLTAYHGTGGDIVLPTDKNITTISAEAFKDNTNITSIVFPKTLTTINARAFKNCSALQSITFAADSDLSIIHKNAFENCTNLVTVDFSNNKTITIDKYAFSGCTSLKQVVNMKTIGTMNEGVFAGCTALQSADITGLHTAGAFVFQGCTSLKEIETAFYTAIGSYMFYGCTSLTEVTINAENIGEYAFAGCTGLTTLNLGEATQSAASATDVALEFVIGDGAFYGCTALTTVNINSNDKIKSIGDLGFAGCTKLKSFDIPSTVSLGDRVFYNTPISTLDDGAIYSKDRTVLLLAPKTVTQAFLAVLSGNTTLVEIAPYAFSDVTLDSNVTTITIPEKVEVIGEGAFAHSGFTTVSFKGGENITTIEAYTFYGMENLTTIALPSAVTSIGASAFEGCSRLATIGMRTPELTTIGNRAFANCQSLVDSDSITLPDSVTTMGDEVFYGCSSLTEINLPALTSLGDNTFWLCSSLETATFAENATASGNYTFYTGYDSSANYQNKLTSVTLGDKMETLGEGVFYNCYNLASIDLKNVTSVGDYAFADCLALTTVTNLDKQVSIGEYAFANCTSLGSVDLKSAKTIGEAAFFCESAEGVLSQINIPVVETIGRYAFYGSKVKSISLPATVTSVGELAFADTTYLTNISVDSKNKVYFDKDGVLYRNISSCVSKTVNYELVAFPTAKTVSGGVYTIEEGTISVGAFAMVGLNAKSVTEVVIPYSVKLIGDGAFNSSGITTYTFEGITAPTLLESYVDLGVTGLNSLYYRNFEDYMYIHSSMVTPSTESTLTINYPVNGTGYTNYVFSTYFGTMVTTAEVMDDTTREVKNMIEGFVDASVVATWVNLEVNAENKAMVVEFSEQVKEAHRLYNNITEQSQKDMLGQENIDKLTAIESALKAVKSRFGITVTPTSLTISSTSTHRTVYVVGEKFDMTGLVLIVTYDDYSEELADMSLITLNAAYDVELTILNRYVIVSGYGKTLQIGITVKEAEDIIDGGEDATPAEGGNSILAVAGGVVIWGPILGVLVIAAAVVAVLYLRKKSKAKADGADVAEATKDETTTETNDNNKED